MSGTSTPNEGKILPTAITPTEKPKVTNPYLLRKGKPRRERILHPGRLVSIMCEHMRIMETNGNKNDVWQSWLDKGLDDEKMTVHPLAAIVQYPDVKDKTLLNVGLYIIEMTPELERYIKLSPSSRHHEPICYHSKPAIIKSAMTDQVRHIEQNQTKNDEEKTKSAFTIENSQTKNDEEKTKPVTLKLTFDATPPNSMASRKLFTSQLQSIDEYKEVSDQSEQGWKNVKTKNRNNQITDNQGSNLSTNYDYTVQSEQGSTKMILKNTDKMDSKVRRDNAKITDNPDSIASTNNQYAVLTDTTESEIDPCILGEEIMDLNVLSSTISDSDNSTNNGLGEEIKEIMNSSQTTLETNKSEENKIENVKKIDKSSKTDSEETQRKQIVKQKELTKEPDIIEVLDSANTHFDAQLKEIMETIANETPSPPCDNNVKKQDIDEYWIEKAAEFDKSYEEKLKHIHDFSEQAINKIMQAQENLEIELNNHTQHISDEFEAHKVIIEEITTQTIDSCCNDIDAKLEQEGKNFHDLVTKNLDEADKVRQQANDTAWSERKNEMTAAHMQLVKTNSIAIKNNTILADKLQLADVTIKLQSKRIIEQNEYLKNLEERTNQVEEKLKNIDKATVEEYIKEYVKNDNNLQLNVVRRDIADSESKIFHASEAIKNIKDEVTTVERNIDSLQHTRLTSITNDVEHVQMSMDDLETMIMDLKTSSKTKNESNRDQNKNATPTMFLNKHNIDIENRTPAPPILTPFQFMYPSNNYHAREVESYKFQKAKLTVKCNSEDNIFTFYNMLRHIANSYNILLRPLQEITKETGLCQITEDNCIGYKNAYDTMATALHMKLSTENYFSNFPAAITYVNAASNDSNGFKLLYRIVEIIHPRLRVSKGGIHKSIQLPVYTDIDDDSIYTYIDRYKNYLLYESLSPSSRHYNKQEQTLSIVNALKHEERLKPGIEYVLATILAYQRERKVNPTIIYPLDLEIDDIAVTIDEQSPNYTVGDKASTNTTVDNPYGMSKINVAKGGSYKSTYKSTGYKPNNRKKERDTSTSCKACMGIGHCATKPDSICYTLAKIDMCLRFIKQEDNNATVRNNTYRYKKQLKEKMQKNKVESRMHHAIKKMVDEGNNQQDIDPIIKLARAFHVEDSDSDDTSDDDSHGMSEE